MEQIDRTFCDNVFDFENANLPKKKLRHKLEQLMPEFAKFVENSNIPGYKDKNFRILTALLTEPSKKGRLEHGWASVPLYETCFGDGRRYYQN